MATGIRVLSAARWAVRRPVSSYKRPGGQEENKEFANAANGLGRHSKRPDARGIGVLSAANLASQRAVNLTGGKEDWKTNSLSPDLLALL
jgi:hypothetical protein